MSFSDFKSVTVWPKDDETSPLVFLIYAAVWFFVLLGFAWMFVGFNATTQLVENGTHVKILNCDSQAPTDGCSDDTTGNYIKSSISFDAWADGIIVGIVAIGTYVGRLSVKREKEGTYQKKRLSKFNAKYSELKTSMIRTINEAISTDKDIKADLTNSGLSTPEETDNFAAQVTGYLLGDIADVTIGTKELAKKVYKLPPVRPLAAAIRKWKYSSLFELLGTEWVNSKEADRVSKFINEEDERIEQSKDYTEYMNNFSKLKF
ncbi:MAG TPA: hypothetical protein VIH90_01325 [Candidatus Saccharimonadales bacterium]